MTHYCQGLNHFPRNIACKIYEQRLAQAYQKRLAQMPALMPCETLPNRLSDVEGSLDWMDNLSIDGWNELMGGPDMDGDI